MGYVNFNNVNPYKLEFVEPWVKEVLDRLNDTTKLVSNNPYTTFKPSKEEKS